MLRFATTMRGACTSLLRDSFWVLILCVVLVRTATVQLAGSSQEALRVLKFPILLGYIAIFCLQGKKALFSEMTTSLLAP